VKGKQRVPSLVSPESVVALGGGSDAEEAAEYRSILEHRLRYLVPVDQPLVLMSQSGRSGGTLLLRLFDGHPECHVVPYELQQIFRGMSRDVSGAGSAWPSLVAEKLFARGRPFLLRPRLQRAIFEACLAEIEAPSPREVLNCFFTSYFNGWLDNTNLRTGPKRWIVGFEPRGATKLGPYGQHYPDGRLISIVRDPWGWFASRREKEKWDNLELAIKAWRGQVTAALELQAARPDNVRVVLFEDLLVRTESTLRALAGWLGIEYRPSLLTPSFNGLPARGRSSFRDVGTEISTTPLSRGQALSTEESAYIDSVAGEVYEQARAAALELGGQH
jgi:sulfotransferase family protein